MSFVEHKTESLTLENISSWRKSFESRWINDYTPDQIVYDENLLTMQNSNLRVEDNSSSENSSFQSRLINQDASILKKTNQIFTEEPEKNLPLKAERFEKTNHTSSSDEQQTKVQLSISNENIKKKRTLRRKIIASSSEDNDEYSESDQQLVLSIRDHVTRPQHSIAERTMNSSSSINKNGDIMEKFDYSDHENKKPLVRKPNQNDYRTVKCCMAFP